LICLHISTNWFLPYLFTRIIWDTIRTIYINCNLHRNTIFPPSIRITISIYIIEWIVRIASYCCIIPRFPRIVFYCSSLFSDLTCKISHIILWFVIEILPRIFSTISKLYIRCKVKRTTLTTNTTTICVSYVWPLKDLYSLIGHRARGVGDWICSCRYTTNTLC